MGIPLVLPVQAFELQPNVGKKSRIALLASSIFLLVALTFSVVIQDPWQASMHVALFVLTIAKCSHPTAANLIVLTCFAGFEALITLIRFLEMLPSSFSHYPQSIMFSEKPLFILISGLSSFVASLIVFISCLLYCVMLLLSIPTRGQNGIADFFFGALTPEEYFPGEPRTLAGA